MIIAVQLFVGPQSDELKDLVEDKEIAACAVAFVVNSTRKGIVPLCADVASLMRSKRRLVKHYVSLLVVRLLSLDSLRKIWNQLYVRRY